MARLRPSNLKCVSAVIRYKIVVNIFHYSSGGWRGAGGAQVPRAKDDDGGRCREIARGRIEQEQEGEAGDDTGPPTSSLLSFESSLRDGTAMDRREARGAKGGEGPARPPGRGEVPSKRRRVVPAPTKLLREFTNSRDGATSGAWESRRVSEQVFCYVNFFSHLPPSTPLSLRLKKRLVKHIKEARWLTWLCYQCRCRVTLSVKLCHHRINQNNHDAGIFLNGET